MTTLRRLVLAQDGIQPIQEYSNFLKETKSFLRYVEGPAVDFEALRPYESVFSIPTYLGLEREIENIHSNNIALPKYWTHKGDGSLRNGGVEFTTAPLPPKESMQAVLVFAALLDKVIAEKPEFSWRTSDQIHLHVLDLQEDEFRRLLLLGFLFENVLFSIAGGDRKNSIFCTPLSESQMISPLMDYFQKKRTLRDLATSWPKYTAINLSRLFGRVEPPCVGLGTIEFRHLGGTQDVNKLLLWQFLILRLFDTAICMKMNELEERVMNLNSSNKYMDFLIEVFSEKVAESLPIQNFQTLFKYTISRAKGFFLPATKTLVVKPESGMALHALKVYQAAQKKKAKRVTKRVTFSPNQPSDIENITLASEEF